MGDEAVDHHPMKNIEYSSVIALIVVNLFPVFGVFYWGWDVFPIMLLFWSENVIVGFYNVLRMMACRPKEAASWAQKLFLIPFFVIHYGGFTAAHGVFVVVLFGQSAFQSTAGPRLDMLLQIVLENNLLVAVLALFASHGYSFITNYLRGGEYRRTTLSGLMSQPYGRVVVLHLALIFGGILIAFLKSPAFGLVLFIVLKIVLDLATHVREHRRLGKPSK
jgi:hypothetical protein